MNMYFDEQANILRAFHNNIICSFFTAFHTAQTSALYLNLTYLSSYPKVKHINLYSIFQLLYIDWVDHRS